MSASPCHLIPRPPHSPARGCTRGVRINECTVTTEPNNFSCGVERVSACAAVYRVVQKVGARLREKLITARHARLVLNKTAQLHNAVHCSDVSNPAEELRISVASPSPQSRPPTSASGMFYQEQSARRKSVGRVTDAACFPASLEEGDEEEGEDHGDGYGWMGARTGRVVPCVMIPLHSILCSDIAISRPIFQPHDPWSSGQHRPISYDARGSRFNYTHSAPASLPTRRHFPN